MTWCSRDRQRPSWGRLYRDGRRAWLAGVCAGIADYFGLNPCLVRALTATSAVFFTFPTVVAYLIAAFALPPGRQHARVILIGRQHFIAGFQVQAELADFQRFAGVARDGDFFHIAAEIQRQPPPDALDLRVQVPPHSVDRR